MIHSSEGSYIYLDGEKFLDFTSGAILTNAGHANPYVKDAIQKMLDRNMLYVYRHDFEEKHLLQSKLKKLFRPDFFAAEFLTTGAEAVEVALRIVLRASKKNEKSSIGTFGGSFHGKTSGAASIGRIKRYQVTGALIQAPVVEFEFPTLHTWPSVLENISNESDRLSGIFLETVQGSTLNRAPKEFLTELSDLCQKKSIIMVIDEIQTGFFRAGSIMSCLDYDIRPDILLIGKGLTSSLPLSAILFESEFTHRYFDPGMDGSTNSGNPLSIAAALGCMAFYATPAFLEVATAGAKAFGEALHGMQTPDNIQAIYSGGHMGGIFFQISADEPYEDGIGRFIAEAHRERIFLGKAVGIDQNLVKLVPPLVTAPAVLKEAMHKIAGIILKEG